MMASPRSDPALWTSLPEVYAFLSPRRKRHLYLLLALMILGALAELATLGSLFPFLSLLAGVDQPARIPSLGPWFAAAGATTPREQIWLAAAAFAVIALIAGAIRVALNWSTQMFTALLGHELSWEVQRRILVQPYSYHVIHNSSEAVAAIDTVHVLIINVLVQLIYATAATFIALAIIAALIYVDPFTATLAAIAFSLLYVVVSVVTRPRLARNSDALATAYNERIRIVQESIGGIRDVIIDGTQRLYLDAFATVSRRYGVATATTSFIAAAPRFIIEATGMAAIALVAVLIANREGGLANALPVLGAVALGGQRLLPLLQQVYHSSASISGHRSMVAEVLGFLRLPVPPQEGHRATVAALPLRDRISIECVSFAYPRSKRNVLNEVTLDIPCGSVVGLVGRTGSGKSTLADLIMGLIEPTDGRITVDGVPLAGSAQRGWHRSIAHVPQAIFLADASITQNIAFGAARDQVDLERVRQAAATAQLEEFIGSLPEGYDTPIGERGIRLSGGQRQRLGIARAIYKQAPVLVLDEATSSLDEATEAAVIQSLCALGKRDKTIIIIAHRLSTLARCDLLVRIDDGRVAVAGSYDDVVGLVSAKH
ncbi:MAG: ABC transporter ATP-binding protein [Sphingomonas sp.]|nr:ABC transporter ATP-binding protein [Sphingomonas sp.]